MQFCSTYLSQIINKVKTLQKCNHLFKDYLDTELATHCEIANLNDNCLIVNVDSAAWLTRLRYLQHELLVKLRQDPVFSQVDLIRWHVQPKHYDGTTNSVSTAKLSMSHGSAHLLASTAASIENPALRDALLRLAQHGEKETC